MAKPIYITNNDVEDICEELRKSLNGVKCYGGIDIKRSFKKDERTAAIYFTPNAWIKMTVLVANFKTEVQWHGMVRRISEDEFEVYDIIVPPHEVSGATVTSEYKPYGEWMDSLDDDTFNAIRFHGHSHADMGVSPSAVDNKYRTDLITQLPKPMGDEDEFYMFLIINRRHEWSAEIYDLTNNALYDTDEIYIACDLEDCDVGTFIAEAKKVAVERQYSFTYTKTTPSTSTTTHTKKRKESKSQPKKTSEKHFGYDTFEDYCEAVYGRGYFSEDEDDDPTSPFYARGY